MWSECYRYLLGEYMDIKVLYEDNHIIVVLKPQNVPTQADESGDLDMLSAVKQYVKEKYAKPGEAYVGLVHRLDRPTGGVMIFARTSKAAARLSASIKDGELEKKYLAVVTGTLRDKSGELVNYLLKNPKTNNVSVVPATTKGAKKAVLKYNVLEVAEDTSMVDISLLTGRSHQIRVQMNYQGCPLYADVRYGGDKVLGKGANLALWAYEIKFVHPVTHKKMTFRVYPPTEDKPWSDFHVDKYLSISKPIADMEY